MARIPIYEQQIVPQQGLSIPRAPMNMDGRGLEAVGDGLQRLNAGLDMREQREGAVWAAKAASEADLAQAEYLTQKQASAQPGATGFVDGFLADYDEYAGKALENAPNRYARDRLEVHLAQSKEMYARQALAYQAQESVRFQGQQYDEGVQASAKLVTAQPELADRELGKWMSTADQMDVPPAARAQLREIARKNIAWYATIGTIDQDPAAWANGAPKSAGSTWNYLDAAEQAKALQYAESKAKEFQMQDQASSFIGIAKDVVGSAPVGPGDMLDVLSLKAAAVERARAAGVIQNEEDQFRLEGYIEQVAADQERQFARDRATRAAARYDMLDQNGGDIMAAQAVRPDLFADMTGEDVAQTSQYAGSVATGATRPTDWPIYNALIEDPALLRDANLESIRDRLNAREYGQLAKIQQELIQDPGVEQNIRATTTTLTGLLEEAGFKNKKEAQARFYSLLQEAIDQELQASGKKKLPQTRVRELANDLLVDEVTHRGVLWDSRDAAIEIEIPPGERAQIEAALQDHGLPVNEYNVLQAYRSELRKSGG